MNNIGHVRDTNGFTLIELLIVVAIIAILAAIAVPNFLEAQTRAKVSRVKADMRTVATALETYVVDYNTYPADRGVHTLKFCSLLTTPVSYVTSVELDDPFNPTWSEHWPTWPADRKDSSFLYANYSDHLDSDTVYVLHEYNPDANWGGAFLNGPGAAYRRRGVVIASFGPDRNYDRAEWYPYNVMSPLPTYPAGIPNGNEINILYDPTNGTLSDGDILRTVGDLPATTGVGG